MGFHLHGVLVLHEAAVALYDRVVPGGGRAAIPLRAAGFPGGWFLPSPHLNPEELTYAPGWREEASEEEWRVRLGIPAALRSGMLVDSEDHCLAALLSLAALSGAMFLWDESFAGHINPEHAATFIDGRFRLAMGQDDLIDNGRLHVHVGAEPVPEAILRCTPTTACSALLDSRFLSRSLYEEQYLPRDGTRGLWQPCSGREDWSRVPAITRPIDAQWFRWFPVLGR
ncbi:hypothetical protein [Hyalangium gracile]|uniref:hypothetical protein n=1 Tax=Hyalangium gracile TaxID=394092 RepID=UPI001CCDB35D|nr:hypothetical protein [Hyalangium gracile]